jgi:putative membrane-bound dehydrogenase-like protein
MYRCIFVLIATVLSNHLALAVEPDEAVASFEIHPDFQIELVASEPVILDPVDLEFDEFGRAFVLEMPGYPFRGKPGNIVLLTDEDDDGIYESRQVWAEGFPVAVSLLPYRGGLLVASPPDLLFLRDTDGDNVADVREVLLSGFAADNTQHNFNGLIHGLDGWIYGANGGNSGSPYVTSDPDSPMPLRGEDFRFNPQTLELERTGRSTGGFEIAFDNWGRYFGTHNVYHIRQLVFPGRYIDGLPVSSLRSLGEISDHEENGLARIFPIGPQVARVNAPGQAGYFSASCGLTFYGGGAFPEEFDGNIFIGDAAINIIHRDVISSDGAAMQASRGRERVEFLASTDRGFRPVNMTVGPDGALYVLDMHRVIIEHPEWIPDEMEAKMDLNAGKEEGRIYRITPKGGLPRVTPKFSRENLAETITHVGHKNKWWRETAQRLLVEWGDVAAISPLVQIFRESDNSLARLHALWTLEGMDALESVDVERALQDAHAGIRENALRIAEARMSTDQSFLSRVLEMLNDEDPKVRMQAALTAGTAHEVAGESLDAGLDAMVTRGDLNDPWIRMAILSASQFNPLTMIAGIFARPQITGQEGTATLVSRLSELLGERGAPTEVRDLLAILDAHDESSSGAVSAGLDGFSDGFGRRTENPLRDEDLRVVAAFVERLGGNDSLVVVRAAWNAGMALNLPPTLQQQEQVSAAGERAMDLQLDKSLRLDELALFRFAPFEDRVETLFELLGTQHPRELRAAAIAQLNEEGDTGVAERLIASWDTWGPETLRVAAGFLIYRPDNQAALLTALENDTIALGQLNLHLGRRRTLLRSKEPGVSQRAAALFTDAGVVTRKDAVDEMLPALSLTGDSGKGETIFAELCMGCHVIGSEGTDLGPNLTDIFSKSAETILRDIVDPNAAVDTEFVSFSIETISGKFHTGILASETDYSVTLREAEGRETTISRDQIEEMFSSGISLMPEYLEEGMSPQSMADLLAHLLEPR